MAVIRQNPKCGICGEIINAIYKDQSDLPSIQQVIGDTFLKWDYEGHKCESTWSEMDRKTKPFVVLKDHELKEFIYKLK